MKKITSKECDRVTHCTYGCLGVNISNIPFDDVQEFLNKRGYDVIIHRGEYKDADIQESVWGTGEVRNVGKADIMTEVVLAVRPGEELPLVLSTQTAKEMNFMYVFQRELRKKLLYE